MKVLIATNNTHKVDEIKTVLGFEGWDYFTLREAGLTSNPVEDADTFLGNARIKALAARNAALAAGMTCAVLADDSGIEVDALGGAPGVHSSRYAGIDGDDAANNAKLLRELEGVPTEQRTGRFVCTLVYLDESGQETAARGTIEGRIGYEEEGDGGFGYDPLFIPDCFGGKVTLAQVSQDEKNVVSHRGNALRELKSLLQ